MKKLVFMMIALFLIMSACTKEEQPGVWVCVREVEYGNAMWKGPDPVVLGERSYDKYGRLVEAYENRFSDMGWENYHYRFAYDAQGRLVFQNRFREGDDERYANYYFDQTYYYDGNGNLTRRYTYDNEGQLTGKTEYLYDEQGMLVNTKNYSDVYGLDVIVSETVYACSSDGLQCDVWQYHHGEQTLHMQHHYDETGALIMERTENEKGSEWNVVPEWSVREYNPDGKVIRTYGLFENGYITNEWRCVYDENGEIVESYDISGRGVITKRTTYEYDENGRLLVVYNQTVSAEPKEQRQYEYLQDGDKQITNVYYASGAITSEYVKYDEHGNLLECGNLESGRYRVYEWVFLPGVTKVENQEMALPEYPPQWIR